MYQNMHCGVSTWWTWSITFNFKSRIRFMLFPGLLLNKTTAKRCSSELHVIVLAVKFLTYSLEWLWPLPTSKHSCKRCKAWFRVDSLDKCDLSAFIWHRSPAPADFTFKHWWLSMWNSYENTNWMGRPQLLKHFRVFKIII